MGWDGMGVADRTGAEMFGLVSVAGMNRAAVGRGETEVREAGRWTRHGWEG